MMIQKTAKPSFHDENTERVIKTFPQEKQKMIISCLDKTQGFYGVDRGTNRVAELFLTFQEIIKINKQQIPEEVNALVRTVIPTGDYTIIADEPYDQDFDQLTKAYVFTKEEKVADFPYGVYTLATVQKLGIVFKKHFITEKITEKYMVDNKSVVKKVTDFFNCGREGRANRMGLLLYGPPGNGKTSSVYDLIHIAETLKIRVVLLDSSFPLRELNNFREFLQGERMVFVFEEMTERIARNSMEEILTFLDGENSWDNTINIATTNYPEDFPANLVDRPGRFEEFILFDNPTSEQIIALGLKFGFNEEESKGLTGLGLSFDYVSYMFSLAKREGLTPRLAKEQEETKRARLSSTFKGKMGF